jgi:hypothetical protein
MQREPQRLVFFDETETTTEMTRARSRCPNNLIFEAEAASFV